MSSEYEDVDVCDMLDIGALDQIRSMMSEDRCESGSKSSGSLSNGSLVVEKMGRAEFVLSVCGLLGHEKWASSAERMFAEASKDDQNITWPDILDYYISVGRVRDNRKKTITLLHDGDFKPAQHSRRETIVKIIAVSTGSSYVYIITSKFGHVGIYDDKLRLQRKYEIDIDTDPDSDLDVGASDPGWITDAIWLENSKHMVYTSSLRTIHFFDASASVHYEEYRGFGLKNIPTCMDFWYDTAAPDGPALLMFGDDGGSLSIITFSQPPNSLFRKDEVDSVQTIFWQRIDRHAEFATVQYFQNLHNDRISGIRYVSENRTVLTSSRDPVISLIITHIGGKFDPYLFKLAWGVACFDLSPSIGVLATGSNDMRVRLWNPVVTARPTSVLTGHKAGIIDIKIHHTRMQVLTYSRDAVLKLWDLKRAVILQTISLHFPAFSVLGKEIEFGRPSVYLAPGSEDSILAICCEHITEIRLVENQQGDWDESSESQSEDPQSEVNTSEPPTQSGEEAAPEEGEEAEATAESEGATTTTLSDQASENSKLLEVKEFEEAVRQEMMKEEKKISIHARSGGVKNDIDSSWTTTREIVERKKIRKIVQQSPGVFERDAPSFDDVPLPPYESFKVFRDPHVASGDKSLNQLRVEKYLDISHFRKLAKDNMPFMALEIHGLAEIEIKPNLPHSENMIVRGITIRNLDDLLEKNLEWKGKEQQGDQNHSS